MNKLLLTLLTTFSIQCALQAQDKERLYGVAFSETDFQSADFFSYQPKDGEMQVLSIAKGMGIFSIGASAVDNWRKEYLIWGQSIEYKSSGFLFDQASGELIRTVETDRPPIDLQFDERLRRFYGLRYMKNRGGIEVIRVNGKDVETLWQLKDVRFLSLGNTAFDSNRGLYIFIARDAKNNTRLYRINMSNGNILDQPVIEEYIFNEFQYDIKDNKLYALARKTTNIGQYFFVEINMLNAYPTIIRPLIGLKEVQLGSSAMNQKKGGYFFIGKDKEEQTFLYELDVLGGFTYSKNELNETLSELHFDNSAYVADFYKDVKLEDLQDFHESNKNYTRDGQTNIMETFYINEAVKLESIDFIKDETVKAAVYDTFGNKVLEQKVFLSKVDIPNHVNVQDLPTGIYTIKLQTSKAIYIQRFVKK